MGSKGKAIAKAPDGRILFIPYVVPGDTVSVQITKKRRAYLEGRLTALQKPSPLRVSPSCAHFGVCGGCSFQHIAYPSQLTYKQEQVLEHLKRIGKAPLPKCSLIRGAEKTYHYRNKVEFSFSNQRWLAAEEIQSQEEISDRNALGYYIPGMWDKVLDIKNCALQTETGNRIRLAVKSFAVADQLSFFDLKKQSGLLRSLMIRNTRSGDYLILLQFCDEHEEAQNAVLDFLKREFPEIKALLYTVNRKANDTFYDQEIHCYHGRDHITEEMGGLRFKITARSFYQPHGEQAHELYKIIRELASLSGVETVYDLYSGAGTIAQFIADRAKSVIGIESVSEAVEAARTNAENNWIENCRFYSGDMKKRLTPAFFAEHGKPDLVITDPPREGMHEKVVHSLLQAEPQRIIYVSCNSATQARDLEKLREKYEVKHIQSIDLFPKTPHVENVLLLEKKRLSNLRT